MMQGELSIGDTIKAGLIAEQEPNAAPVGPVLLPSMGKLGWYRIDPRDVAQIGPTDQARWSAIRLCEGSRGKMRKARKLGVVVELPLDKLRECFPKAPVVDGIPLI